MPSEDTPTAPINPYGTSKLMSEWMLRDLSAATGLRHVVLRYFNVAGSDPAGADRPVDPQRHPADQGGRRSRHRQAPGLSMFGTDYPTPDGTGVRDYIHVDDLATAHLDALRYLRDGGGSTTLNCGYGHGYSVREVLQSVERVSGGQTRREGRAPPRGRPAVLVAKADRIKALLGWKPALDDLDQIVRTSLAWEQKLLASPW